MSIQAELVTVGASWGGMEAISRLLADIRADFSPAIAMVLHRGPEHGEDTLTRYLQTRTSLPVAEVSDKLPVEPGHVYIAPADYHTLVEPGFFALSLEAPVHYSRPSIDVMFETAAEAYGEATVGVLLTGANADGAAGMVAIKAAGGHTFAQDPATAARPEMPASAIAAGAADHVMGIEEIASELNALGGSG